MRERVYNIVKEMGKAVLVGIGCIIVLGILVTACSSKKSGDTNSPEQTQTESVKQETETEAINRITDNANTPSYKQLNKNADKYKDVDAIYTGKVVQALEEGGKSEFRIEVTKKDYDMWDDVIFVGYAKENDIVEGDIVKIYGTLKGKLKYKSQAGWDITVPSMMADVIKIVKKSK